MDDLFQAMENSLLISTKDELVSRRRAHYKCSGITNESARDKRRKLLLDDYKRRREALLAEKRGLLNDEFEHDSGHDWMDWQEPHTEGGHQKRRKKWYNKHCQEQLMLSEWLLDRPADLDTAWTLVICPTGRRTLVIANKGSTKAYHKSGLLLAKFRSILPQGSPSDDSSPHAHKVILDCIWKADTRQLFALDVLYWNQQTLLDCDAQFRLYWLKSKLNEVRQCSPKAGNGVYDVFLPHHCNLSTVVQGLEEHDPTMVDGVLFYHNSAPYVSGQTPLVGWLKPFMLQERFGLTVPEQYLAQRPPDYQDLEQWVAHVSHRHRRQRKAQGQGQMDTDTDTDPASPSSTNMDC